MSAYHIDTHPKVEALQIRLLRSASPARKMEMLAGLYASAKTLTLNGLRRRYPQASEAELRRRLVGLLLGEEAACKVYGDLKAEAVSRYASFNIIHRESMFKVDVFIPRERDFVCKQFARPHRETLSTEPEIQAVVATAEDTLLAKLEGYRPGGEVSERQWRDVLGLLLVQAGALDLEYLRNTAKRAQRGRPARTRSEGNMTFRDTEFTIETADDGLPPRN
jgi:hypothetical protein